MKTREYSAPCGLLLLGVHGDCLCLCDWMREGRTEKTIRKIEKYLEGRERISDDLKLLSKAERQLDEYFERRRTGFDLPLHPYGTDFQLKVWEILMNVPYGRTSTYKSIAEASLRPSAIRAVANSIGANPMSIIIPCHRIIGADGDLAGYAGGVDAKKYLIELEKGSSL